MSKELIAELQAKISRVEKALKDHSFDVLEAAFAVDDVVEARVIRKALEGPTEAELIEVEIELHEEEVGDWDDDIGDLVCTHCKRVLVKPWFNCPESLRLQEQLKSL